MIRFRRRCNPVQAPTTARQAPIQLTSATDGHSHLISSVDLDPTISEHGSLYRTLCGRTVLAAALAAPPGPHCRDCYARRGGPTTASTSDPAC